MTGRSLHRLATLLFILLGFALRLYRLDAQALSGDEAFSIINWTRVPLSYLLDTIAVIDPQPPLALLSLYGWVRIVGDSEFASRMLSVLVSMVTIATVYGIGRLLANRQVALAACLLCAINPYQIWHAQDVRNYALWMSGSAVSAWLLLRALRQPSRSTRWLVYVLAQVASIYTFYLEGFTLLAHNLYIASRFRGQPRLVLPWITSQVGIGLLLAPWFLRPQLRDSGYRPTAGSPDIPQALHSLLLGETLPPMLQRTLANPFHQTISVASILATLVLITGLIITLSASKRDLKVFLPLYTLIPIVCLAALALITGSGYFRPRYASASSPPLIIMAALLITQARNQQHQSTSAARYLAEVSLATLMTVVSALGWWHYHFNPDYAKAPNWPDIVETLYNQGAPTDLIIRNFPDPAFEYYYKGQTDNIILPDRENAAERAVVEQLNELAKRYDYLWFFPTPSAAWDRDQIVAAWLAENTQAISEQWIDRTHLLQYSAWEVRESQIRYPVDITFGDIARLIGYRLTPLPSQIETQVTIELFWQPISRSPVSLTVFVHLLGPPKDNGSPLWAQDDHPPQDGRLSTETWEPGKLIRDVYHLTIPATLPDGTYTVTVGLYDPTSDERLLLAPSVRQGEPNGAVLFTLVLP